MSSTSYDRYAIYFSPEKDTPLAQFGHSWFGFDPEFPNKSRRQPSFGLAPNTLASITDKPRRYGFHATLKAPFRLAAGTTAKQLCAALTTFAKNQKPFVIEQLELTEMAGQLVLTAVDQNDELVSLAADCVSQFDQFRASQTLEDKNYRNTETLSARQIELFKQWGYPYIFDEFRFHLTLTKPLSTKEISQIKPILAPALNHALASPVSFESICLFGDPGPEERFRQITRFPFLS